MCLFDVHTDKIVTLSTENKKLKNEGELFRGHWEQAEDEVTDLWKENKELERKNKILSERIKYYES